MGLCMGLIEGGLGPRGRQTPRAQGWQQLIAPWLPNSTAIVHSSCWV